MSMIDASTPKTNEHPLEDGYIKWWEWNDGTYYKLYMIACWS
jgi:hypothetical protein